MEKRLLLVSRQKNFMINAMTKNFAGEDYEVILCTPDLDAFDRVENRPQKILVYLDDDADQIQAFLIALRDHLGGDLRRFSIYLIASADEAGRMEAFLASNGASSLLDGVFERPVNVKKVVENLNGTAEESGEPAGRHRILVVDDDATMLRTLKLWLSDQYFVYMANSGMNAISVLKSNKVDLVLMDYEMPEFSGPEVLRFIKEDPQIADTPVMFLTAKNDKESIESVMALKAEKYLLKTMPPDELMRSIREYFETA